MSDRIVAMRTALRDALVANGCPTPSPIFPDWNHVVDQIGKLSHTTPNHTTLHHTALHALTQNPAITCPRLCQLD
jgi:hypothetical protein